MKKVYFLIFAALCFIAVSGIAEIKVQYMCGDHGAVSDNHIKPHLKIINNTAETINLSDLKIRYYYTKDGVAPEQFWVDYAQVGSTNITYTFGEGYVEIGFLPGTCKLSPGSDSGPIQIRFNMTDWKDYNESNDYSWSGNTSSFADCTRVTLHRKGKCVWGTAPGWCATPSAPMPTCAPTSTHTPTVAPTAKPSPVPTAIVTAVPTTAPTEAPTAAPTTVPVPTPLVIDGAGNVWIQPASVSVAYGASFQTEVRVNTGNRKLAAYEFDISFDNNILTVDTTKGTFGVEPGADGFVTTASGTLSGLIRVSGFDTAGKGPGNNLDIAHINWVATGVGLSNLSLTVQTLVDETYQVLGIPSAIGAAVNVTTGPGPSETPYVATPTLTPSGLIGDVNGDGKVDVVDGLLVIQYYVGLNPAGFDSSAGDVNRDGSIDIVDGLLILQSVAGEIHIPTDPTPEPVPGAGAFSLSLNSPHAIVGDDVIVNASLDTGNQLCAAYSLVITYPVALLSYSSIGAGTDGFVSVTNAGTAGMIVVSGFDVMGKGPGTIQLLIANFIAKGAGTALIVLTPEQLIDVNTYSIGTPQGASVQVIIEQGEATSIPTPAPTPTPVTETTAPTITPTETPGPTSGNIPGAGNVWFEPSTYTVNVGDNFDTYIRANTGDQVLGAYGFEITFDGSILSVNASLGSSGVDTDGSGFVTAGINTPGFIKIAGYDTYGRGPGTDLAVVTIHWTAIGAGTSPLTTVVTDFVALGDYTIIGAPNASNGSVTVTGILGEVTPPPAELTPPPVESTEPPAETPNPTPDAEPTPIAEATSTPGVLQQSVWFSPAGYTANVGDSIVTPIHLDSKGNMVAAYGFTVAYPYNIVHVDTSSGTSGVKAGSDGFVTAVNANVNGTLVISGFDVSGKGPGTDLDLIRINWTAIAVGSAALQLTISALVDIQANNLDKPAIVTAHIDVY